MGGEGGVRTGKGSRRLRASSSGPVEWLKTLKSLPVSVAILDRSGEIVAVNAAWKAFGRRNGLRLADSGVGADYLRYAASGEPASARLVDDLKGLLAGRLELLTTIYPCHSPSEERWFSLIGLPLSLDGPAGVALLHINLTDTLPLPVRPATRERKEEAGSAAGLEVIGEVITRSVSRALSSQLNTMLSGSSGRSAPGAAAASAAVEQTLVDAGLSKRQLQVLRLLGEGKNNVEIAQALSRSPNTIKLHVSAILQRLNLKSRTQAALLASKLPREGAAAPGREASPLKNNVR